MKPLALSASLVLAAAASFASDFPAPYNTEPDPDAAPPSPREALALLQLPEGFTATLFAAEPEVRNPIAMAWDSRGRLWVAENYTYAERGVRFAADLRDRVLIFEDTDGDGEADSRTVFTEDLQTLTSVEVGRGGVWVMCPPRLLFIPDRDGDDVPDGAPEVVLDGFTVAESNYHNFANGLRWGPDGWLYGRCGHSCPGRIGKPGTPDEARIPIDGGIWRYQPRTGRVEVLTHGTTNPWGHDWDAHGELFFINTVNGHLWHGIAGAHFRESFGADPNPGVYERLDTHADHWHFDTSGKWTESRDGNANAFGGGHAHIGMMIYQANQWPDSFRNRLYTLNMHGFRTNVERLDREGSGYVGRHEDDLFLMGDAWFRGIDLQQGPDGSVYVLDWSDTGECHEHTGVHRTSGRIYRISAGRPGKPDLSALQNLRNARPEQGAMAVRSLLREPNVWFERQLRILLTSLPEPPAFAIEALTAALHEETDAVIRLRALWTLHALDRTPAGLLTQLLESENEHLRVWAIRLLTDSRRIDTIMGPLPFETAEPLPESLHARFVEMAQSDSSGLVRLALASTLQRLPVEQRGPLGLALASRSEDSADHNLPSMVWYGLIPLAESAPMDLVRIAQATRWPDTLRWMARSLGTRIEDNPGPVDALLTVAAEAPESSRLALLDGLADGFEGWRKAPKPESWDRFVASLGEKPAKRVEDRVRDLSALFGDGRALEKIREVALNPETDLAMRRAALLTLIENRPADLREVCETLLEDRSLSSTAAQGLAGFDDPALGQTLAKRYRRFYPTDRPGLLEMLVSRPAWAAALLTEMEKGSIARSDLTAFQARQIRAFEDETLNAQLAEIWGVVRESAEDKRTLIAQWTASLTADHLAAADLSRGRILYQAICGSCHVMYGEGGRIGPDLTGSGRADLGYLLENIIDPNAVVSADYQMSILTLGDGRILTGVVAQESDRTLTLRQATGESTVSKAEIARREISPVSMMPEGLILAFQPDQVRDLIAYLMHPVQVPLPGASSP